MKPALAKVIAGVPESAGRTVVLRVTSAIAEEFRDAFTLELARIGFDANYGITSEGRILEDLIDAFRAD